jgi:peptidoglycan hydrolase-like protein with peptidoglycan-binding domain
VAESFFNDEELDWWGDTEPAAAVALPHVPRRRPPARTLAGDLRRLRAGFERRSPIPAPVAGLLGLALLVALAVAVRLSLGGEAAPEPVAATPSPAVASATTAESSPAAPAAGLLKEGKRGPQVHDLQVALTALGLLSGADGTYSGTTSTAVASFQGSSGLEADGVAGPVTAAALNEAFSQRALDYAATAEAGIAAAVEAGRLDAATAEEARGAVADTVQAVAAQSPGSAAVLVLALRDVAALADGYTTNRAALFEQLRVNVEALADGRPEMSLAGDVADGTGVLYRYFPEHGYQFHPLASFIRLNNLARKGKGEEAGRLADALVARGVRSGKALLWQYRFTFGGPDVWTSGFAQALGAQALARTGELLGDRHLTEAAAASFHAIPRDLTLPVAGGDWIQEYSFSDTAILNAQLESTVALREYAELTGNEEAGAYVAGLSDTTKSVLDEFDTGCWSLYSLGGKAASSMYHTYHVHLLERLGRLTRDPVYRETGQRWRGYLDAGGC